MTRILLLLLLTLAAGAAAAQTIYRWTDDRGKVHYGNEPPRSVRAQPIADRVNSVSLPAAQSAAPGSTKTAAREPGPVVMYSTSWCTYCAQARAYFAANRIRYQDYDVEKSAAANAEYKRLGGRGVPLIVHGGQTMSGFSEAAFKALVARSSR
jgi:glutaredoxin